MSGFDSYTKLLISFNGADGATSHTAKTGQTVTFAGTAQLDTAIKKLGSASLLLGATDYVTVPTSTDYDFGTGKFTIDSWLYFADASNRGHIPYSRYVDADNYDFLNFEGVGNTATFLCRRGGTSKSIVWTWDYPTTTWTHVALVRDGTTAASWHLFLDGVDQGTPTAPNPDLDVTALISAVTIGTYAGNYFEGNIDEYRISKGVARWTANFTPPSIEYNRLKQGAIML